MDAREKEISRLERRRDELEDELRQLECNSICNWARHEHVTRLYSAVLRQLAAAYQARNMPRQEVER